MDLSTHLRIGTSIEIQLLKEQGRMQRMRTMVERGIEDDLITISAPMEKGRYIYIPVHTVVTLQFMVDNTEGKQAYGFKAKIINVTDSAQGTRVPTFQLEKISDIIKQQRRETFRLPIVTDIKYQIMTLSSENPKEYIYGPPRELLTKNISITGLRGVSSEKLPTGTMVTFEITTGEEPLRIKARILESSNLQDSSLRYDTRAIFLDQTVSKESALGRYIMQKQSEGIRKSLTGDRIFRSIMKGSTDHYPDTPGTKYCDIVIMIAHMLSIVQLVLFSSIIPRSTLGLERRFNYLTPQVYDVSAANSLLIVAVVEMAILALGYVLDSSRVRSTGGRYRTGLFLHLAATLILLTVSQYLISLNN